MISPILTIIRIKIIWSAFWYNPAQRELLGVQHIIIAPNNTITNLDDMSGDQNTLFKFGQQTINGLVGCYGLGKCIILKDYAYQEITFFGNGKKYYRYKYTPSGQTFSWPSTWIEIATV